MINYPDHNEMARRRAAFGPATFARFGLWSKTLCRIGWHRWDGFPKGLRICKDCDRWDG